MGPDMAAHAFNRIVTFCALGAERTRATGRGIGTVDSVTLTGRGFVGEHLSERTKIAIVVLIVHVILLSIPSVFCVGTSIRHDRTDLLVQEVLADIRRFIPCIHRDSAGLSDVLDGLLKHIWEDLTVMNVGGCDDGTDDKAVLVAGCMEGVSERLFLFVFDKPAAVWIGGAFFTSLQTALDFFGNGFFPCATRSWLISSSRSS